MSDDITQSYGGNYIIVIVSFSSLYNDFGRILLVFLIFICENN